MKKYYERNWPEVIELLGSDLHKGLMEYDCTIRRKKIGTNEIVIQDQNLMKFILKNIINLKNIFITMIAISLFLGTGNLLLLISWFVFCFFSLGIKTYIQLKKYLQIEKVKEVNQSEVTVIREGIKRVINTVELVKGDIVALEKGAVIGADIRVIASSHLKVNESLITGKNEAASKNHNKLVNVPYSLSDISNVIYCGTSIEQGSGTGIVIATGNETVIGRLIKSIKISNNNENFIKVAESRSFIGQSIGILILIIYYLIFPGNSYEKLQIVARGFFIATIFINNIILAIQWIRSKKQIEKENIIINDLSTLSNSKDVKVLFVDKLNSLSKNKLIVKNIFTDNYRKQIENIEKNDVNVKRLVEISLINSNIYKDKEETVDNLFSQCYLEFAKSNNISISEIIKNNIFKFRWVREGGNRVVTTVVKTTKGYRANCRGNLDEILSKTNFILINGVEKQLTLEDINRIRVADYNFYKEGYVTEAMAYRSFNYEPSTGENIESNLVFVGLVALENPLTDTAREDVEALFDNGVLPIVFCEDNKINAEVWARKCGLIGTVDEISTGAELRGFEDNEIYKAISRTRVFSCVSAEQKELIISAYIKDKFRVAMVGEKITDLATITSSNIGIATGKAPMIVKQVTDATIGEKWIKSFLNIRKRGQLDFQQLESINNNSIYFTLMFLTVLITTFIKGEGVLFNQIQMILVAITTFITSIFSIFIISDENLKVKWKSNLIITISIILMTLAIKVNSISYLFIFIVLNNGINLLSYGSYKRTQIKYNLGVILIYALIICVISVVMALNDKFEIDYIQILAVGVMTIINRILIFFL